MEAPHWGGGGGGEGQAFARSAVFTSVLESCLPQLYNVHCTSGLRLATVTRVSCPILSKKFKQKNYIDPGGHGDPMQGFF